MRENNSRRGPGDRRDRRFEGKREPRAAAPAPVEEEDETRLEGRNAITEALRAGRTIDKVSSPVTRMITRIFRQCGQTTLRTSAKCGRSILR